MNLRIPGPTPVPAAILGAMTHEMINHRGPEFAQVIAEVTAGLKRCLRTEGDVLTLTGSGTGGLEAAVVNTLSPGDPVLAVTIGWFGDRIADIAQAFGADVTRLAFAPGQAADPEQIRDHLRAAPRHAGGPGHPQRVVDRRHQPAARRSRPRSARPTRC